MGGGGLGKRQACNNFAIAGAWENYTEVMTIMQDACAWNLIVIVQGVLGGPFDLVSLLSIP